MTETEFAALNEHLHEVHPILDAFCARHGFAGVDQRSLGRYPRIRIERRGLTNIWFDLWMESDEGGHRVDQFRRDVPYELSAGVYIDVQDGSRYGLRLQKAIQCFSGKPFDQVGAILQSEMEKHLPTLEAWNVQYLKDHGERVQLGS